MPLGVVLVDSGAEVIEANGEACRILGLDRAALQATGLRGVRWEVLDPDGAPRPGMGLPDVLDAIARQPVRRRRLGIPAGGGVTRWVEMTAEPLGQGGIVATVSDVSDWHRLEADLQFKQDLLAKASDCIYVVDPDSRRILFANEAAAGMLGYAHGEMLGMRVEDVDTAFPVDQWPRQVAEALAHPEGLRLETWHRRKDGSEAPVEVRVRHLTSGGRAYLVASARDAADRRAAEAALQESSLLFRESQEAASIGSYRADFVTGLWNCSEVMDRIFGIGPDYLHDIPGWLDLVHPEDRDMMGRYLAEEVIGRRQPFHKEYRIRRKSDGATRWVLGLGRPVHVEDGPVLALVGTIQDITGRKAVEEERHLLAQQLARTQRLESLGSLASGVAHDMNNVLAAILSLASVHQMTAEEGSALRTNMDTIAKACERGRSMVQGLLGFARQGLAEEQALDLNVLAREVFSLLERTALQKATLELDLDPGLRPVRGDPSALSHALMNLCVNALDAIPDSGRLAVRTRNLEGSGVLLEVADTGTGMTAEVLERAMDPFFTTKEVGKGTGLGLSQVYSTVKAHRGRMELKSRVGQGTTVSIRLPSHGEGPATAPPRQDVAAAAASLQVLLVDDDELIRESIGQQLEVLGHRPVVVESGEEALAWLQAGNPCDAVILDLNMPGLGGAATLPRLRRLRPATPVLLATGRADQAAMDLVASSPGTSLLAKPFTMADLREALQRVGET